MAIENPSGTEIPSGAKVPAGAVMPAGTEVPAASVVSTPLTIITSVPVVQWVRSDLGITIGTGVSAWADQSGNVRDFTQGTGAAQPTYSASDATLNNQPILTFDGVAMFMDSTWSTPASGTTPSWICTVIKQITWSANKQLFSDKTVAKFIINQNTATPQLGQAAASAGNQNTALAIGSWGRIETGFFGSVSSYLKLNSTSITGTSEGGGGTGGTGTRIGCTASGTNFANFAVAEIIRCNGIPSAGEISSIDSYITGRYGAGLV